MSSLWKKPDPAAPRFWIRLALALGVILIVAAVSRAQQPDAARTDASQASATPQASFAGAWKLNRDESDDPREKLRSAIQDRNQNGNPGGMGRHGGMGGGGIGMGIPGVGTGGGMGRPGNGPGQSSGSDEQHARLFDLIQPPDQIRVAQKEPEIDLTDTDSHTRALFTDGRKLEKPKKDALQTQVKARWERQTLITDEKGPNGEKISHSYELSPEGKFIDTVTLESKRLNTPIIVRSVYDKAD
jgi:hypothetical protein